jgi:serine protease Do
MNRIVLLILACGMVAPAQAEVVILNNGHRIEAEVLKEWPSHIVVDLGFDVLRIPRDQILRVDTGEHQTGRVSERQTDDLYSVADLPRRPVGELSKRFEEGVVMVKTPGGLGSGFIIDENGYVITNFHVIEGETRITLNIFRREGGAYRNEKIEDVRIIATNAFLDVALLKFDPPEGMTVTTVYLNEEDKFAEGDTVFAIGNPLGLERTVSQGIISKTNRREGDGLLYVQTTTQINPGNSGGPLFNDRGEVIGITNAGYMFAEGLNYAIPVRYVVDFLKNRDAYTYDLDSPTSGHQYIQPGSRVEPQAPDFLRPPVTDEPARN